MSPTDRGSKCWTAIPAKVVGSITGLKGTHGVALDDTGKYGYVSDGGANAVVVFDRASLATVASIPAGTNPDGIVFEPVTKTVWAFNGRSNNATVIDTAQRKVVATIPLSGKPEFPVADGSGTVFANIETKNEIVRFDAAAKKHDRDLAGGQLRFALRPGHRYRGPAAVRRVRRRQDGGGRCELR